MSDYMDALRQAWSKKQRLARAYKNLFLAPDNKTVAPLAHPVLADLRDFCFAKTSCIQKDADGKIDTHATAVAEGRREVWLRFEEHLTMDATTVRDLGDANG